MDPQLWLMLEASWHAFEDAEWFRPGLRPGGVFAGAQFSLYWPCNVRPDYFANQCLAYLQPALFNGRHPEHLDILQAGLCGPSVNVQTACSTGLVAVATACQNLLDHSCDLALAVPQASVRHADGATWRNRKASSRPPGIAALSTPGPRAPSAERARAPCCSSAWATPSPMATPFTPSSADAR
jgi:hypothetical protein